MGLLNAGRVLTHPFVIGELALGRIRDRDNIMRLLDGLPAAVTADEPEILHLINHHGLAGSGIGYVDAHLLAATRLTPRAKLLTRDKRLGAVAATLGLSVAEASKPGLHEPSPSFQLP